jgi:serine/threonine protein kinase
LSYIDETILARAGLISGLLTQEQIDHALQVLSQRNRLAVGAAQPDEEQLAECLTELGYLNHWQAEQLRKGRTKFTLGPYRILDAIGHGGMGYVFKGEHSLLGRIEAIKVLPSTQTGPEAVANFCREIRALAQLDHPNLVRLSYADKDGGTYFLVTEFVPGADLRRLIRHHGPLSPRQAALVIAQAAEALAHAHERGLVHRDVKPGNLLVTDDGHTKLTDLGLAAFASGHRGEDEEGSSGDLTIATQQETPTRVHIVGTPDFVAPETIISPGEVRAVSDIYSLGCTLYYAMTGKVPFPGGKTRDKLRRHVEENPITPLRFSPHLPPELVELTSRMMCKKVEGRIQTAAEVVTCLAPWISQVDDATWAELGQFAREPPARSYSSAVLEDTAPAITRRRMGPAAAPVAAGAAAPVGYAAESDEPSDPTTAPSALGFASTVVLTAALVIAVAALARALVGG